MSVMHPHDGPMHSSTDLSNPDAPANWARVALDAPELAADVRARFTWTKHHVLATLRADGAPRVSGSEVEFFGDELMLGSMWHARKALDLLRDGRCAVHSNPGGPEMEGGDAKVSAIAFEVTGAEHDAFRAAVEPPPGPFHLFRLSITDVVHTALHPDGDRMIVRLWRPGRGVTTVERA